MSTTTPHTFAANRTPAEQKTLDLRSTIARARADAVSVRSSRAVLTWRRTEIVARTPQLASDAADLAELDAKIAASDAEEQAALARAEAAQAEIEAMEAEAAAAVQKAQEDVEAEAAKVLAEKRAAIDEKKLALSKLEAEAGPIVRDGAAAMDRLLAVHVRGRDLADRYHTLAQDIRSASREIGEPWEPPIPDFLRMLRSKAYANTKVDEKARAAEIHPGTLIREIAAWFDWLA